MNLRQYQKEAINAILSAYNMKHITRPIISLPTGCGKTAIFATLTKILGLRTLILAHREELLTQAKKTFDLFYHGADVGIFQGKNRDGLKHDICIASVQTAMQDKNLKELMQRDYRLLVCDEAHHSVGESYQKIFRNLGFLDNDKNKLLLGVTATAFRSDEKGLHEVYDEIVFERSILAMIQGEYLCKPKGFYCTTGVNIEGVRSSHGDFIIGELANKVDTPNRNKIVVDTYMNKGENRHGVVFCTSVQHALNIRDMFKQRGVSCEAVWGEMPNEDRHKILSEYKNHDIQMLTNCSVLTEGWDEPDTDIIMMARPTQSRVLYVQCIGRGLRKPQTKPKENCYVFDFVDNSNRHNLCTFGNLFSELVTSSKDIEDKENKEIARKLAKFNDSVQDIYFYNPEIKEIDLFKAPRYVWHSDDNRFSKSYKLSLIDGSSLWCDYVMEDKYKSYLMTSEGKIIYLSTELLPLGYAQGVCEDYARKKVIGIYSLDNAQWRCEPISLNQCKVLDKRGIKYDPKTMTKAEASELISSIYNEPITKSQLAYIRFHQLHSEGEKLTKKQASELIDRHKKKLVKRNTN